MKRVKATAMGMVMHMPSTMGGEIQTIMAKEPTTVTRLVRICTRSAERQVVTTSMS